MKRKFRSESNRMFDADALRASGFEGVNNSACKFGIQGLPGWLSVIRAHSGIIDTFNQLVERLS